MKKQYKRAYTDVGGGYAVEAPYVQDQMGQIVPMSCDPAKKGKPVPIQAVAKKGLPIINQKNADMQNENRLPVGVGYNETPSGRVGTFRSETPNADQGRKVFRAKISNTEVTDETIVLGDPTGEIKRKLGVAAPKAGVNFAGMYGADTYDQIQAISGLIPFDLHKIKFQGTTTGGAASTDFFDSGRFAVAEFDVAGNTLQNNELVLSDLVQPSDFNTNIRADPGFRFQLQAVTGMIVTIPAGEEVLITCDISAAGLSRNMDKV